MVMDSTDWLLLGDTEESSAADGRSLRRPARGIVTIEERSHAAPRNQGKYVNRVSPTHFRSPRLLCVRSLGSC